MRLPMDRTVWQLDNPPRDHFVASWRGGRIETARRSLTRRVEGRIAPRHHLVMVTLEGGAERHAFRTDDGLRFAGRDVAGSVSFLPAGCGRDLALENVAWEWGAIAIDPEAAACDLSSLRAFVAEGDPFLYGMVVQMRTLLLADGGLDETYCGAMSLALCHYLSRRQERRPGAGFRRRHTLSPRQLRETLERIEAWLPGPIRIGDLAAPLGLSEGHFYRAFRGSTGQTPLNAISARRIELAARLLGETQLSIAEIAFEVGLASPSHLARLFREQKGISPFAWRRTFAEQR